MGPYDQMFQQQRQSQALNPYASMLQQRLQSFGRSGQPMPRFGQSQQQGGFHPSQPGGQMLGAQMAGARPNYVGSQPSAGNPYAAMLQQQLQAFGRRGQQQPQFGGNQQQGGFHPLQPGGQLLGLQMPRQQQNYLGQSSSSIPGLDANRQSMFGAMAQSFAPTPGGGSQYQGGASTAGAAAQQGQGLGPNAAPGAYSVRGMPPGGSPFR